LTLARGAAARAEPIRVIGMIFEAQSVDLPIFWTPGFWTLDFWTLVFWTLGGQQFRPPLLFSL
jgi:hypothetical protein